MGEGSRHNVYATTLQSLRTHAHAHTLPKSNARWQPQKKRRLTFPNHASKPVHSDTIIFTNTPQKIQHDTHTKRMHTYQTAEPAVSWLPLPQTAAGSHPSSVDDKQDDMVEKEKGKKKKEKEKRKKKKKKKQMSE